MLAASQLAAHLASRRRPSPRQQNSPSMAKKAKARVISVRLLSMAMTGFFYQFSRPRTARPMSMLKYDPVVRKKVLFLEQKRKGK
ncbi:hypothetical protein F5Y19DRAFT_435044 [Xylariaceae sp. FL1651]|nr:hypothetical protein F5Y19DRAFT_435044 [Xylariaceae sp. FL1651]